MKVVCYPADDTACGAFRVIWPAELLAGDVDVTIVPKSERKVNVEIRDGRVSRMAVPPCDVVVLQRVTHVRLAECVSVLRRAGHAVVVDVDDDLAAIHPSNPAFAAMHPNNAAKPEHSWRNLEQACRDATLVTATTPRLLERYAPHGRGIVIPNYLPDHYYTTPHEDSTRLGWPASLHSHPNDPEAIGSAIRRIQQDHDLDLHVLGHPSGVRQAFGLDRDAVGGGPFTLDEWPAAVAGFGVGIAPLADTRFNAAKSWLKPLEMSALGVPWVASPRIEYQRLHDMGAGMVAEKPGQWYAKLDRLLSDETLRKDTAEAGRAVAEGLRLRDHAWRWAEAWAEALRLQHQ